MDEAIRVLLVEDFPTDAGLNEREVQRVLPKSEFLCVETREDFLDALGSYAPDIILSDYKLPQFDGMAALKLAQERVPQTPFILVTGSMNEETAVDCMKAGAWDYVIKEHIRRLGPAVLGALEEKRRRQEQESVKELMREGEKKIHFQAELLFNAPVIAAFHDCDHNLIWANKAYEDATGMSVQAMAGKKCYSVWGLTRECHNCPTTKAIETGEPSEAELTPHNQDHWPESQGYWLSRAAPVKDKDGNILGAIEIAIDISERGKLEQQLRQSQKMESIGTLAGGIAHDFNNILTVITGYGQIILLKMAADDPKRQHIEQLLEASDRAAHLTKDLLLFSRKHPINKEPVDLNLVIEKVEKFLKKVIGEDIACRTILHESELPVLADTYQLEQILMNMATNARDAMPHGGQLTLSCSFEYWDKVRLTALGYGKTGSYALVTVSDTGTGMDTATLQRIFEPFFTTKEIGKGTGLGLAVAYGIVKGHGGFINAYSELGKGTTFRVYLPLITAQVTQKVQHRLKEPTARGSETILLAEDDDMVRNLNRMVLEECGYTVIEAVDGEDALQKFRENADTIQLLLFDMIMPKMSGKIASDEIYKLRPGISTIFTSGYSVDIIQQKESLQENINLIPKPVSPLDLLKKVREVLDLP